LRTAAVFLRISSQNSPKATRNGLLASATELESEALRVQAGSRNSVTALDQTFARAEYALARHHHAAATESWGKKQTRVVGYRMKAAANSAERATVWTGQKVGEGAKGAYQGARTLSGGLIEGSGFVVDQVGKGLGAVGDHIFQLGKKVSPQPVSPQSLKRLTEPRRDFPDCPLGYRGAGADRPVRIDPPRRAFFLP
ncbi:MAG: hypothetical protein O3A00_07255, partial [Planctomycetota bacterium]|nr:hypothetical protein [Planctomycetota bacterium]